MRKRIGVALVVALAAAAGTLGSSALSTRQAMACGGVFLRSLWKDERRPSLTYEQTLLIHDSVKGREHFVREVTFTASKEPFGFVVPLPTRPEVAKVTGDPFERMRAMFPFRSPNDGVKGGGLRPGSAGGGLAGGQSVHVLEQKKVGSFTAFVLAADEPTALADWLKKRGLASNPQADVWLAHYVKLGYFYVAMRYDPPKDAGSDTGTHAEIVRFSFDTPLPYYPYYEPDPASGAAPTQPRMAEIWLVSQRAGSPVCVQSDAKTRRWVRPFIEGMSFTAGVRPDLEKGLGSEKALLPAGDLVVQRFVDQKTSRVGFGDTLFVPASKVSFDDATRKRIAPLLAVLDPVLAGGAKGDGK